MVSLKDIIKGLGKINDCGYQSFVRETSQGPSGLFLIEKIVADSQPDLHSRAIEKIDSENGLVYLVSANLSVEKATLDSLLLEKYYVFNLNRHEMMNSFSDIKLERSEIVTRDIEMRRLYFDHLLEHHAVETASKVSTSIRPRSSRLFLWLAASVIGISSYWFVSEAMHPDEYENKNIVPEIQQAYREIVVEEGIRIITERRDLESDYAKSDSDTRASMRIVKRNFDSRFFMPPDHIEYDVIDSTNCAANFGYFKKSYLPYYINAGSDSFQDEFIKYFLENNVTAIQLNLSSGKFWYLEIPSHIVQQRSKRADDKPYKFIFPDRVLAELNDLKSNALKAVSDLRRLNDNIFEEKYIQRFLPGR